MSQQPDRDTLPPSHPGPTVASGGPMPVDPRTGRGTENVVDRRSGLDRREVEATRRRLLGENASPAPTGLERRRGPGRRLSDFTKKAEEGEMTKEQFLFLCAIEAFKKANAKTFPTWTDVLEVVRLLGYRKTMASEIALRNAEDWLEAPDTKSNVRPDRWHQRESIDRGRGKAA